MQPDDLTPELRERYAAADQRIAAERARRGLSDTPITGPRALRADPIEPARGTAGARQLFVVPEISEERLAAMHARAEAEATARFHAEARQKAVADRKRLESFAIPLNAEDELALLAGTLDMGFGTSIKAVRKLIAERPADVKWCFLCGGKGRGKTLAAAWALWSRGGQYTTAPELERLANTRYGDEADAFRQRRARRELLVLDELGLEQDPQAVLPAFLDLVDRRRGAGHLTIAIANMSEAKLRARYADERLWSRLEQCAAFVGDSGPDMRKPRRSK